MSRALRTVMMFSLALMPLLGTACEDKESKEALNTCRNDLGNEQKNSAAQLATINALKTQLAQAQAKLAEAAKPAEVGKDAKDNKAAATGSGKAEEKAAGKEKKRGAKK